MNEKDATYAMLERIDAILAGADLNEVCAMLAFLVGKFLSQVPEHARAGALQMFSIQVGDAIACNVVALDDDEEVRH